MPGIRRPAECPACAVEAKRRRLAGDATNSDHDSDQEDEMDMVKEDDSTQEQGDGASLGACEHICKRCMECKRVLATSHLLDLHLREAHDAMFALLAEKQPMYECFEESCEDKYKTSEERLKHAVKEHGYSKKFRITKKQHKPPQPKKDQVADKTTQDIDEMEVEKPKEQQVNETTGTEEEKAEEKPTMKSKFVYSYKVPSNVCFGKGTQKGFHRPKHWHQQNRPKKDTKKDIENIDMSDLMDSTWKLDT